MPSYQYGRKEEPRLHLEESDDMLVVRTRSRRSLRGPAPVLAAEAIEVGRAERVLRFERAGVEVYRIDPRRSRFSLGEAKAALREMDDVAFAGGVLTDPASGAPVVYSENLFVKFHDDADSEAAAELLRRRGLTIKRRLDFAANSFFVGAPPGTGQEAFAIADQLLERDDVEYCHPELLRRRRGRAIAPQQWHLAPTVVNGFFIDASANVAAAHALTQGAGITIAVIDDGFDLDHVELSGPGQVVAPRELYLPLRRIGEGREEKEDPRALDPRPKGAGDSHGTACAGVACARGVAGASGVAPAARLMPIRSVEGLGSVTEAEAFVWAADHGADVISCSWGPEDGEWSNPNDRRHHQKVAMPPGTRMAIDYATSHGRGGKGCAVFFAAGNGNESVDNDGYASYPGVIAVAACNDRGQRSVYSDFGAAVFCSFPSDDFRYLPERRPWPLTPGIWTLDRAGADGFNPGGPDAAGDEAGLFTDSFGGTSSACPGAAGVAALALSRHPELTEPELREVLRRCCVPIDPEGGGYLDGRSPLYGYGRLDAARAVELAGELAGDGLPAPVVTPEPVAPPDR